MGLLGDIFSAIDTKKRQLKGLLEQPAGTVDKYVSQLREDNRDRNNLFANAYPMAGDRTVLNSPAQIAQFQREAADTAANMGLAGATVWHGSPHKFDKFDSSKIGTGEGAQAYGHGLYLAEAPTVAKSYADELGQLEMLHNGKSAGIFDKDASANAAHNIRAAGGDVEKAIKRASAVYTGDFRNQVVNEIRRLGPGDVTEQLGGQLYKVDLPDEHIAKMLDWDKPLSQQAPEVQSAMVGRLKAIPEDSFSDWTQAAYRDKAIDAFTNPESTDVTGSGLYKFLQAQSAGLNPNSAVGSKGQDLASDYLRQAGIPGIRYLDGGSRGAGQGSSNYVVFPGNEDILKILERNGKGLLAP